MLGRRYSEERAKNLDAWRGNTMLDTRQDEYGIQACSSVEHSRMIHAFNGTAFNVIEQPACVDMGLVVDSSKN